MNRKETLINEIDKIFTASDTMTEDDFRNLAQHIPDINALDECLPAIKEKVAGYIDNAKSCESRSKTFSASNKMWKTRGELLVEFVGYVLKSLGLKNYKNSEAKATITVTRSLETDEDALLAQYRNSREFDVFMKTLPDYVKVSLTINKTALNNHVKIDHTLLTTHPEWIHTKEKESVNLK